MAEQREIRIRGRAVSRGIAIGKVVCLYGTRRQFVRRLLSKEEIAYEIERLRSAHSEAIDSLKRDIERSGSDSKTVISEILDSHLLLLEDKSIHDQIISKIESEMVNTEFAVQLMFDDIAARFRSSSDEHFREKAMDLDDVADRLLVPLGAGAKNISLPADSIIVAKEVRPSTLLEFVANGAVGLIAESGGWTSHTSILARESKIPAVTGVYQTTKFFKDGQTVVVDGFSGDVFVDPSESRLETYRTRGLAAHEPQRAESAMSDPIVTLDGREMTIRTNATSADSYRTAQQFGAKGIGLYRSESLISKFKRIPNEEEQVTAYIELADAAGEHGVRIRTFDIDSDEFFKTASARQKNPALGIRAIRLGIAEPELLATQIRSLLRAAKGRSVNVIVPMVTGISELITVNAMIKESENHLSQAKVAFGSLSVGAMIEIPSAILVADQLSEACDFLCLGTNDLAQYLLAADRDNDLVSNWFRTLHPAMIRAVRRVIDVCKKANKPLIVCGEMAGSPFYVPVLIGLGATELSMNPSSIDAVRRVIAGVAYEETIELVKQIEALTTADEIENTVAAYAKANWPHLYSPGFLESQTA